MFALGRFIFQSNGASSLFWIRATFDAVLSVFVNCIVEFMLVCLRFYLYLSVFLLSGARAFWGKSVLRSCRLGQSMSFMAMARDHSPHPQPNAWTALYCCLSQNCAVGVPWRGQGVRGNKVTRFFEHKWIKNYVFNYRRNSRVVLALNKSLQVFQRTNIWLT